MAIDFRVRPPFKGFRTAFGRRGGSTESDEVLIEGFIKRLDEAGITKGVVTGRNIAGKSGGPDIVVPNEDVAELVRKYPTRFEGFGAVDVRNVPKALDELDKIAGLGLKGVAFDNPWSNPALYDDDKSLFPIYEKSSQLKLIVGLTASAFIGPDISYSNPAHVQRVASAFPELTIVVPHGSWPWTTQIAAVLIESKLRGASNIYILPDVYLNPPGVPGRQDYIDLINWTFLGKQQLFDRVLFASSFPAQDPLDAVRDFKQIDGIAPEIRDAILFKNAERILGLA
ncbi:MAG: amidohydrolase family protein [Capsulimonadaceae bacterium]|nr:amidohydrolase family protein [Capsulimonadaceae bacterium]